MFPIIQIGPLALQAPGLLLLISLWIGITLAEKSAKSNQLSAESLSNLILVALISGIIGARLIYVARFPSAFLSSPLSLFSLNPGLLDVDGGVFFAILGAFIYGQRKKMLFWNTLDALVPFLGMLAIGLATANLASGNAFGKETSLPWGIELWGAKRHPTQIYTLLAALLTLNLLWSPQRDAKSPAGTAGRGFLIFIAVTAGYTLFFEAFRGDSTLTFGGIRSTQVVAWGVMAVAFWAFERLNVGMLER